MKKYTQLSQDERYEIYATLKSKSSIDEQFNWVIIDATECLIERPKKKSE
ncbi:hypothetical protein J504_1681 [Acinetobacter baumannii 348935]|nr:hypothetical protein J504_1681 [Acinetobacter baumannii 348935]